MIQNIYFLIPVALGLATILQTQIVKSMGQHITLVWASLINNITGLIFLAILALITKQKTFQVSEFRPVYLLAGIFGALFVLGAPFAVQKIGPGKFFIFLVASEIIFGMMWQFLVNADEITPKHLLACALVITGALLSK